MKRLSVREANVHVNTLAAAGVELFSIGKISEESLFVKSDTDFSFRTKGTTLKVNKGDYVQVLPDKKCHLAPDVYDGRNPEGFTLIEENTDNTN